MNKTKGIVFSILASICYGLTPLFSKFCFSEELNVETIITFRYILSIPIILSILLIKKQSLKITKKQLSYLVPASIFGPILASGLLVMSYQYIESGLASILHYIYPLSTSIATYFIFKEAFTKNKVIALISSFTGVTLISYAGDSDYNPYGAFLAIFSGIIYTAYVLLIAPSEIKSMSSYLSTFYLFLFAAIFLSIFYVPTGKLEMPNTASQWLLILGLTIFPTCLAMSFFFIGVKNIGPSKAAILCTFEPVVSIVTGILVFGESLSFNDVIGSILVFSSIIIISMPSHYFELKKR